MTRWVLALVLGGAGLAALIELIQRQRNYYYGPHYVQQLEDWQKADPVIPLLPLPEVKPLKAIKPDRVARFAQRLSAGRHL